MKLYTRRKNVPNHIWRSLSRRAQRAIYARSQRISHELKVANRRNRLAVAVKQHELAAYEARIDVRLAVAKETVLQKITAFFKMLKETLTTFSGFRLNRVA